MANSRKDWETLKPALILEKARFPRSLSRSEGALRDCRDTRVKIRRGEHNDAPVSSSFSEPLRERIIGTPVSPPFSLKAKARG